MHLEGPAIAGLIDFFATVQGAGHVAFIDRFLGARGFGAFQIFVHLVGAGRNFRRRLRPSDLERSRGFDRGPFGLGDHADEFPLTRDHDHAGNSLDRILIDGRRLGVDHRRAHDAAVQHTGDAHVVNVIMFPGYLGRQIGAFDRFTDDLVVLGVLCLDLRRDFHIPAGAGGGDSGIEFLAADKLAVGSFP